MNAPLLKLAMVRLVAVLLTVALLPLIPIAAVKLGFTSAEYLHRGVLQGGVSSGMEVGIIQAYMETTQSLLGATFGNSLATGQSVDVMLKRSLIITAPILGFAVFLSLVVGVVLGIVSMFGRVGSLIMSIAMIIACVPMVALAYLSLEYLRGNAVSEVSQLFAPAILLSLYPAYLIARTTRTTLVELSANENAQFLRACGLSERRIFFSQVPKPLSLRLVALVYPTILYCLSFSFFVETPFGIPGFGQRFLNAVQSLDYPVIIGFSFSGFLLLTVVELTLALTQAVFDPRLRHE